MRSACKLKAGRPVLPLHWGQSGDPVDIARIFSRISHFPGYRGAVKLPSFPFRTGANDRPNRMTHIGNAVVSIGNACSRTGAG